MSRRSLPARACPICGTALTRKQVRRPNRTCSRTCGWTFRAHIRLAFVAREYPPRDCQACATPLTRRQLAHRQRFCSLLCANRSIRRAGRPNIERNAVLALFRATRGQWLTYSDLAIWRYGDDSAADINAVRMTILHLRREGHRFQARRFPWPTGERQSIRGFRLLEAAEEVAA